MLASAHRRCSPVVAAQQTILRVMAWDSGLACFKFSAASIAAPLARSRETNPKDLGKDAECG
jgi:hypothetical protein